MTEQLVKINNYSTILFLLVSKILYVCRVHLSFDIDILNIVGYSTKSPLEIACPYLVLLLFYFVPGLVGSLFNYICIYLSSF